MCGDLPAVLEELAVIYIVKGRPEVASVFLNALAQNPFHRGAARDMLSRLEADPRLEDDPRVSTIRRNMLLRDNFYPRTDLEPYLKLLLEKNPKNKMAFDFLLAQYLVNRWRRQGRRGHSGSHRLLVHENSSSLSGSRGD